jgi:hypothetical protein
MSIAFIALAALIAGGTQDGFQANKNEVMSAPTEAGGSSAKPRKETRYCMQSGLTGTRIPVRECHTRKEWLALGVDPTAKE